jgi:hypothetical protein
VETSWPKEDPIVILYVNARSANNKLEDISQLANDIVPKIICVTESWTNDQTDAELKLPNYDLVGRADRKGITKKRGGGVLVYADKSLATNLKTTVEEENLQLVHLQIQKTNLITIYRAPDSSKEEDTQLFETIRQVEPDSLILGDFNFNNINWDTYSTTSNHQQLFIDSIHDAFLEQHVKMPTHQRGNILDLVLTNNHDLVSKVECFPELSISDHFPMVIETNIANNKNYSSIEEIFDYRKADFNGMRELLCTINWPQALGSQNTEGMWQIFKNYLSSSMNACIPKKRRRIKDEPLWMNHSVKKMARKKKRAWNTVKKYPTIKNRIDHKNICQEMKALVATCKEIFERKLACDLKQDPKLLYSYMKSKTITTNTIKELQNEDNEPVSDDQEKAELFNKYFGSVFNLPQDLEEEPITPKDIPIIDLIYFSPDEIIKKINLLKTHSSPGPDQITPKVLKELAHLLALPLSIIFNKSIQEGAVPEDWKMANVTPIYKAGDKTSASNYRPISLTSHICKIMERIINDKLKDHLESNLLLSSNQHGFRKNRSCITNLLEYWNEITRRIDQREPTSAVYFDFQKAFDKVPHQQLLQKLSSSGITGRTHQWIKSWLSGRKQRVVLNGQYSSEISVTSSVPQGSVLGPTLFLVFINDLTEKIQLPNYLYADDTKIIGSTATIADKRRLQDDIDNFLQWSLKWQMPVNVTKCKILPFGKSGGLPGSDLELTKCEKDLGVLISSNGKFNDHISKTVMKANRMIGMVKRSFKTRNPETLTSIYKRYILPILSYASPIWSPSYKTKIQELERAQKRFVRLLFGIGNYTNNLAKIGLKSLEEQRKIDDLVLVHKIYHQKLPLLFSDYFDCSQTTHNTRSASNKHLTTPKTNINKRSHYFAVRTIEWWNLIPLSMRECNSDKLFLDYLRKQ